MSENVVQPGIEPGSPDYRSDALTTRPLNQPRMLRVSFKALQWLAPGRHCFTHIFSNQDHLTTPPLDR